MIKTLGLTGRYIYF